VTPPARTECAKILAQIEAYVDKELDSIACDAIDSHCRECEPCTAIVRGLRQTIGFCREVGRAPLPASISGRAREQMRRLLASSRITPEP